MLFVHVGNVATEVELDFESVGEGHFVTAFEFLTVNDELFWETADDVAGDVAGYQGDRQTVGAFHLFPDALGIELDDGSVGEQGFVFLTVDVSKVYGA